MRDPSPGNAVSGTRQVQTGSIEINNDGRNPKRALTATFKIVPMGVNLILAVTHTLGGYAADVVPPLGFFNWSWRLDRLKRNCVAVCWPGIRPASVGGAVVGDGDAIHD